MAHHSSSMRFVLSHIALFLFSFFLYTKADATHLMGGNLGYRYMGETFPGSDLYRYEVTFKTYINCTPPSNFINGPETWAKVGVYSIGNSPSQLLYYDSLGMNLSNAVKITPQLPGGCNVGADICIWEAIYTGIITVPLFINGQLSKGYYLFYDRCCRNGSIINLDQPGDQGLVFYAYIPPPLIANSSPVFTDLPVPYICVNDTNGILNTAVDADGDLLVFSFEDPYRGFSNATTMVYPPFPSSINWPVPVVTWQTGGYNKNNPFSPSGYAFINAFTGYTQYKPIAAGNYVVAVEIKEYRNGNLIGISRRDLQIIALNCPANSSPVLSSAGGSGQTSYTIEEGQQLCFPVTFTDAEGNTIKLTSSGTIFDSSLTNPVAAINTPVTGNGNATAQFCWTTGCSQGQALPYLFNAVATDAGCPPKSTPVVYSIKVTDFQGASTIAGKKTVCAGEISTYSVSAISGATYSWIATGAASVTGTNTNSVAVTWGNGPSGSLKLNHTSQYGCVAQPLEISVSILSIIADAGKDSSICSGDSLIIGGSPAAQSGASISWIPPTGLSSSSIANPLAKPAGNTVYVITVNDPLTGCVRTDTVTVLVNALPVANVAPSETLLCIGESVQLLANGGIIYSWSPASGLSNPFVSNPIANPVDTTVYTVTVTGANGCKKKDSLTVNVVPSAPAEAGNDTTFCSGQSTVLGGSLSLPVGTQYLWSPGTGLNNTTSKNPVSTAIATTTYTVTVTLPGGCTGTDSVTVNVLTSPVAAAGNDSAVCFGQAALFNASGNGTYIWYFGDGDSSSSATPLHLYVSSGNYTSTLVVTGSNGCRDTDTVNMVVHPLPPAEAGPDVWICPGSSVQLSASGGNTYLWSPANGLSNIASQNPIANPTDSTRYFVNVTDTNNCSKTDSVLVVVNGIVPTDAGSDKVICTGDTVVIGGNPTSPNSSSYSWQPAVFLSDSSVSKPFAFPSSTTVFYVNTTNDTCTGIDSVMVKVNNLPVVDAGPSKKMCIGDTLQLNATGGKIYAWTTSPTLSDTSVSSPLAFPIVSTMYYVTAADSNSCVNYDSVSVVVNPLPVIEAGFDTSVCLNDSVQLSANGPMPALYAWYPSSGLSDTTVSNPFASPVNTLYYFIAVTDSNGCKNYDSVQVATKSLPSVDAGNEKRICRLDSIQLNAIGGVSWLWSPATGLSNINIADPFARPSDTTMYLVTAMGNNGCRGVDSVLVVVYPLPVVDAGNDAKICIGDSVKLSAKGGKTYTWSPATGLSNTGISEPFAKPTDTTRYYVIAVDTNTCKNNDSVFVIVNPLPVADAGKDILICKYLTSVLGGAPSGPVGATYKWTPVSSLNNAALSNPSAKPDSTTSYIMEVKDTNGCLQSDTMKVYVFRVTNFFSDTSVCKNDSVALLVIPSEGTPGYVFAWSPPDGLSSTFLQSPKASPQQNITYTVVVQDMMGCKDTNKVNVVSYDIPKVVFDFAITPACEGLFVEFKNKTTNASSYQWQFGDGTLSSAENPSHLFVYNQPMKVTLTATNQFRCSSSFGTNDDVKSFTDYFKFSIPNVFTPNGDDKNEWFELPITYKLQECMSLNIYNRWGELVFTSRYPNHSWDGRTFAGEDIPAGVYFYVFNINGLTFKGAITLLR